MRSSVVWLGLATLMAVGCEHPVANTRLQGPLPAQAVSSLSAVPSGEAEQAVLAHRTLETLLRERITANVSPVTLPRVEDRAGTGSLATPPWLETQSTLLATLVARSRAAALAVGPDEQR
jgi:hypothetical protein